MSVIAEPKSVVRTIQAEDTVLIWFDNDVTYLVEVIPSKKLGIHCGQPIQYDDLIGRHFGDRLNFGRSYALLLEPTVEDYMMKAKRESGIIYPKDASMLMMRLGMKNSSRVIEVGTGSGALTLALASQVAPNGKVYTYDVREDFQKLARNNLRKAKLLPHVEMKLRTSHEAFVEEVVDAIVLDIPEPWHEMDAINCSLKNGGRLAALNPTYNQIELMSEALRRSGFIMIEAMEILVRGILARLGKTRPELRMIGHTEFILFALKPGLLEK